MSTPRATVAPAGPLPPGSTLYLVSEMAECPVDARLLDRLGEVGLQLDAEAHEPLLAGLRDAGARLFLPASLAPADAGGDDAEEGGRP